MKKLIAAILASLMVLSLAACGGGGDGKTPDNDPAPSTADPAPAGDPAPDGDAAPSTDMNVAMVTDSGDITDQSFNQTTYETAKKWSEANGVTFNDYKPEKDTDEARNAAIDQAVAAGANVILLPGYMFAASLVAQTNTYPDVKFIGLDVGEGDLCEKGVGEGYTYNPADYNVGDYYNTANTYCATYQEEISGFMAGYAAVKLGYRHLGFLGGMSVPAVMRFGYGYVQGADKAAADLGCTGDVTVEYVYGGQFFGDADITAAMDTWYSSRDVEVVFACGGGICTSAGEAAAKVPGTKVIGVDVDQSFTLDAAYGEGVTLTSAMKGLAATVNHMLDEVAAGNFGNYGGKAEALGLVSGDDPNANYVLLPMDTTLWGDGFSQDDYKALVKDMFDGKITVSDDISAMPAVSNITVNDLGNIK